MNRFRWTAPFLLPLLCSVAFADEAETANLHFQTTTVTQAKPRLESPYAGFNSLAAGAETKTSLSSTLFLGYAPWKNTAVYVNPEIVGGTGLSGTRGVAGFPNGEIFRVESSDPKLYLSRIYLQQTVGFGGDQEWLVSDKNQLAARVDQRRITFTLGRFSLNDFFDQNTYSHDPRTQFMNWALMDNAAWDYAADTRGYTWGLVVELNQPVWAFRLSLATEPQDANSLDLDPHFWDAYALNWELEYRDKIREHPGKLRFLSYLNRAYMGNYAQAVAQANGGTPNLLATRTFRFKYGFSLNGEQEASSTLGLFFRLGWALGDNETWTFTEAERTATLGASFKGTHWHRENDTVGLALILNGISHEHAEYLGSGGYGFLLGDGQLNYAPEEILETYYLVQLLRNFGLTLDYQFLSHPGYNADRGPAQVASIRLHFEI